MQRGGRSGNDGERSVELAQALEAGHEDAEPARIDESDPIQVDDDVSRARVRGFDYGLAESWGREEVELTRHAKNRALAFRPWLDREVDLGTLFSSRSCSRGVRVWASDSRS